MRRILTFILTCLIFSSCPAFAYFDNYPPYSFKNGPSRHLEANPLVDFDKAKFKSKDGKIYVRLKESADSFDFILKDTKLVLAYIKGEKLPLPNSVYQIDLDGNGKKDFIVFYNYRGKGIEAQKDMVEIYLKRKEGLYRRISYDTFSAGLEDFVDLDRDGKYEVIITGFCRGDKHNYFTYNIYKPKGGRLANADAQFKDYPKFIWITHKKNDKDSTHLTKEERSEHTIKKNDSIRYHDISKAQQ
ncbi:MAG: VCBS repeat-containing protein [Candidatus Omnitrophica bacterium]|nr:VCBS repeat-containing protein [Candidatus Omnitrophota bacterium]